MVQAEASQLPPVKRWSLRAGRAWAHKNEKMQPSVHTPTLKIPCSTANSVSETAMDGGSHEARQTHKQRWSLALVGREKGQGVEAATHFQVQGVWVVWVWLFPPAVRERACDAARRRAGMRVHHAPSTPRAALQV